MIYVHLMHLRKCVNLILQAPAHALAMMQLVPSSYNCRKHDTCALRQGWQKGERRTSSMLVPWMVRLMSGPSTWARLVGTSAATASSICRQQHVFTSNVGICLVGMSGGCTACNTKVSLKSFVHVPCTAAPKRASCLVQLLWLL